jgi:hypothetical protein
MMVEFGEPEEEKSDEDFWDEDKKEENTEVHEPQIDDDGRPVV